MTSMPSPSHQRHDASTAHAIKPATRLLTTSASVIGASADCWFTSWPWASARSSRTCGSSRCPMPGGPLTAEISRSWVRYTSRHFTTELSADCTGPSNSAAA
jgi:hypothetical protein